MRHCYEVVTGPMFWKESVVEYLPGVWDGPTEEYREGLYVWARSRRDAIKAAVRKWQRGHRENWRGCCYPHDRRRDGLNPFAEITAKRVPDHEETR